MDSSLSSQDYAPLVGGLHAVGDVLSIHTEASDADVANTLTEMMAVSPALLAAALADAPADEVGLVPV